jgi:hypothetical protein
VHDLRQTDHRLRNHYGCTRFDTYVLILVLDRRMVHDECTTGMKILLGALDGPQEKLDSVHLEIVLISTQDRCTVCTECPIGLKIILGTLNGTPR